MPTEYNFGEDFQLKLLALYVREPQKCYTFIEPSFFTSPILLDCARLVQQVYEKHNFRETRLSKATVYAVVKGYLGKKRADIWPEYKRTIRKIFDDALDDQPILIDQALQFAKERQFRKALVSAENDINNLSYDAAIRRFDSLKGYGVERDLGLEYWNSPDDPSRWRIDRQGTIGTFFIPKLDRLMGGGPGAGELAIVLAGGKAGKSTCLARFAAGAMWQNKNVAFATGELSAEKTRKRIDAMITGYSTSELTKISYAMDTNKKKLSKETRHLMEEALYRMRVMHNQMKGRLFIKQWPTNKGKIQDIETWMDQLKEDRGVNIDILFVDYIRVFKPNKSFDEQRMSIGEVALDLRGLAVQRKIPVWTAQQTNRAALSKERLEPSDIAEDISQFWTLDFLVALSLPSKESGAAAELDGGKKKEDKKPVKAILHLMSARDTAQGGMVPVYIDRSTFRITQQDKKDI